MGEAALMEASMRDAVARGEARVAPHRSGNVVLSRGVAPLYRALPWPVLSRLVTMGSGARGWKRR